MMDRRQIGLGLTLRSLGLSFEMESFQDRLIVQKAAYLAQESGVNLGYFFSWYLRGPYCSALTNDAFSIKPNLDELDEWNLDTSSQKKVKKLANLMKNEDQTDLAKHLELLASVHFLVRRKQISQQDSGKISDTLKRYDKDFDEDDVCQALGELTTYGLL
jgi:uncharacterized protein YwgA